MKIIEKEFNALTGETTITERDATLAEIAQFEKAQTEAAELAIKQAETAAKRQALLDRLGITEEEARLLLG